MTTVIGTTNGSKTPVATPNPSTALKTEIAGRDHAVAVQQSGAEQADGDEHGMVPLPGLGSHERNQGEDAALAAVVGAHHERQVFHRDGDDERPEDERENPEHVRFADRNRVGTREALAQRVQGTGANVAVYDANGGEDEERSAGPVSLDQCAIMGRR